MLALAAVVYVAFNALTGLPFQSRYHLEVTVPDADRLIVASDVKAAGVRVGQIQHVTAIPSSPPSVRLQLSLDASVGPIPVDSRVAVRSASPLGATYLELTPGRSHTLIPDGGSLAVQAAKSTDLVDLFDVFDNGTRLRFQQGAADLSAGLAGRGPALNGTLAGLDALLPPLTRVSDALATPSTQLERFVSASAELARALDPARGALGGLFAGGARTMAAIAAARGALASAIGRAPTTEQAATRALRAARPALQRVTRLSVALVPAAQALPSALGRLDAALRTGTPALDNASTALAPVRSSLRAVASVSRRPATDGAVRKLGELSSATSRILNVLLPAQTQCNLIPLFFQEFSSVFGVLGVGDGGSLVNLAIDRVGATGDQVQSATPAPNLHSNYVPHENRDECEAGNEPYDGARQLLGNPPGKQRAQTRESTPPPLVLDRARSAGLLDEGGTGR